MMGVFVVVNSKTLKIVKNIVLILLLLATAVQLGTIRLNSVRCVNYECVKFVCQ
jgi:hypothetical protein